METIKRKDTITRVAVRWLVLLLAIWVLTNLMGDLIYYLWDRPREGAGQQEFNELLQSYIGKRVYVYPLGTMTLEKVSRDYILLTEGPFDLMLGNRIFIPFHSISVVKINLEAQRPATIYVQYGKE